MKILKTILRFLLILFLMPPLVLLGIYFNYHLISFSVRDQVFIRPESVPESQYALVLGAGQYKPEQWINHSFNHRMQATAKLFEEKKVRKIIVSGIRSNQEFDEVSDMKQVLITFGVPEHDIITDNRGTRTWNSIQNVKNHLNVKKVVVVSQLPHLERALFISNCLGLEAVGFKADPAPKKYRFWTVREYLARIKSLWECIKYKFGIGP